MKIYASKVDDCSGFKEIGIFQTRNKRALFGIYYGYFSVFWRVFYTNFQLVDIGVLSSSIDTCSIEELTAKKLISFMEEPLSLKDKIKLFIRLNILKESIWIWDRKRIDYLESRKKMKGI